MVRDTPSWAVVATVDEPPALVQAFVAWHLALGASEVSIYCDNPDDPLPQLLAHLSQVTVIACDAGHWHRVNKTRPHRHEVRQVCNASDAYAKTTADWLLHCDADEFVWSSKEIKDVLAQAHSVADALVLPVAERVVAADDPGLTVFEGAFRRPFRGSQAEGVRLFGPQYDLTNRGLTGHTQGKAIVRTGRPLRLSIHRPRSAGRHGDPNLEHADRATLELLHFEGLTPLSWAYKLIRMASAYEHNDGMPLAAHRRKQADAVLADPQGARALYDQLKRPDAAKQKVFKQQSLWVTPPFDPANALAALFSDQKIDLTPQAIDGWLQREKSDVLSFMKRASSSE